MSSLLNPPGSRTTAQCKQVAHQIPISGREGGDQTHETTAEDVLRCWAEIGTSGVWFGGGGGVFLLPERLQQRLRSSSRIFNTFSSTFQWTTQQANVSIFASMIFSTWCLNTAGEPQAPPTDPSGSQRPPSPTGPHLHPRLPPAPQSTGRVHREAPTMTHSPLHHSQKRVCVLPNQHY